MVVVWIFLLLSVVVWTWFLFLVVFFYLFVVSISDCGLDRSVIVSSCLDQVVVFGCCFWLLVGSLCHCFNFLTLCPTTVQEWCSEHPTWCGEHRTYGVVSTQHMVWWAPNIWCDEHPMVRWASNIWCGVHPTYSMVSTQHMVRWAHNIWYGEHPTYGAVSTASKSNVIAQKHSSIDSFIYLELLPPAIAFPFLYERSVGL